MYIHVCIALIEYGDATDIHVLHSAMYSIACAQQHLSCQGLIKRRGHVSVYLYSKMQTGAINSNSFYSGAKVAGVTKYSNNYNHINFAFC